MSLSSLLIDSWIWKMAWRDSRRSRRRLILFSTSIIFGIAALVAIGSFGQQMEEAIEVQAKALLGADLVIASRDPFTAEQEKLAASLGGVQAREINFSSMVFFPKSQGTRLAQVRALEGGFPFYGSLETEPPNAASDFCIKRGALVEQGLMDQFGASVGDSIKVGNILFPVLGRLRKVPGETTAFSTLAPRVYIPLPALDETGLLKKGSLARYKIYFRFSPTVNVKELVEKIRPQLERMRLGSDTVDERKRDLGRAMDNLYHFLNLAGFVSLLLGAVGISSAVHAHIKQKLSTVAILRCLGASIRQTVAIYVAQALALGMIGAIGGALLGLAVQWAVPAVVADFAPIQLAPSIAWLAVVKAMVLGIGICLLFALLPLLAVRRVSPLAVFRVSYESAPQGRKDPWLWLVYSGIGVAVILFGISQSRRWTIGLGFGVGLWITFGLLVLVAKGVMAAARKAVSSSWPYVLRQGVANLYRPNNRTLLLMIALGLGTFLILTMHLIQTNLVTQLFPKERGNEGNAVLFDIQSDQTDGVSSLLSSNGLPILEHAPIITMRISSVKGRTIEEIKKDHDDKVPAWTLNREYRSTYREALTGTEKLVKGTWHARADRDVEPIPVSIEEGIAQNLKVSLGDEIVFDVQGVPLRTVIASVREVDWRRLHPNFFFIFPVGVLDEAPSFHVFLTRVNSSEQSALLQREMAQRFPNVSVIDLTLVLQTIDSVLTKISFVVRFMALFTVATGLLVLAAAVITGRYQRVQESVLLRTLGATRLQVLKILAAEYLCLGILASITGVILAVGASWALSIFVFKVDFSPSIPSLFFAVLIVSILTVIAGMLTGRGINRQPPLEVLRAES